MTTERLGPRVESFTCEECERVYPSALAAARCAQLDTAETD